MNRITGSIVALITPFNDDESINFQKLGELLDWHVENKTDGILVLGTTSEAPTMTDEEELEVCRFAVEQVAGRVPVIASSGSNCTANVIKKSLAYQELGADAVMNIAPYYNKANKEGMYRHFADVADAIDIPMFIYNIPGRTGCSIPVDVVGRLSQHERIIGIKEASGNLSYTAKIAKYVNENFSIYSGNDDVVLPVLSLGGSGVISVIANIMPETTHNMVMQYVNGDAQGATREQLRLMEFINNLFIEVNPIPIKEAMNMNGMGVGRYRLPLCEMEAANREILRRSMEGVGLI